MNRDEYECYDKTFKESDYLFDNEMNFWCWSRKDFSEDCLKNELNISTSYRYKEYNTSFTTSFQFNGTSEHPASVKCNNDDDQWAQTWYDVSNDLQKPFVPCNTSTIPMIANFKWDGRFKL